MADEISDADKIRQKRMAKMNNQNAVNGSGSIPSNNPSQENSTPTNKPEMRPTSPKGSATPTKPSITIRPSSSTTAKRDHPQPASQQQRPRPSTPGGRETPEEWEHRTLSSLFRVTLDPGRRTDAQGNSLYYDEAAAVELESEGKPKRLTVPSAEDSSGSLEGVLPAAAAHQGRATPLEYFLACWKRITRLLRSLKNGQPEPAKVHVANEAKRLCMSYSVFAVTIPDMFESQQQTSSFAPHLLADESTDTGLDYEWLQEAASRIKEDDELKEKIIEAAERMSADLASLSMNDDYRSCVQALLKLLRFAPLATAISESVMFLGSNVQAQDIEKKTLLGPYFQLSALQPAVAENYFSAPRTRDRGFIANSQNALRMTLSQHQQDLYNIVDRFVKISKDTREKVLHWLALTVNTNHMRRAIQPDPRYISSDGFMVNVTVVLDRLAEPFMDATFTKIGRIDVDYLRRSPRVKIDDETKINADQKTSDEFYAQKLEGENNFISEIFFLCAAAHHYGTEAAQSKMSDNRRMLKRFDEQLERYEAEREKQPAHVRAIYDMRLSQLKKDNDRRHSVQMASEGVLADEQLQTRAMSFMRYVIVWVVRLVSGVDFPRQAPQLPLSREQPDVFKCLPEYFLEDVVDHFKFITAAMPHIVTPLQCEELVTFCVTFLESSEYIKNPGLKSGMVLILFHGTQQTRASMTGPLGNLLNSMGFAIKYLLHALMKAFIECESTGAHNQFYEKFNTRYEIFHVIKQIWPNVIYREQLAQQADLNKDFFVRFTNLLLNDATYLLDEAFGSFQKVSELEAQVKSAAFASLPETEQTEKREALDETRRKAKGYMPLVTETVQMLKIFTAALADSFTQAEVVQRLADMLDYNLDAMVGPKRNSLRVENKHEYNFHPASMLADIAEVYLNLGHKPSFHAAIAKDGRSYRPANFEAAENLLRTHAHRAPEELARWRKLAQAIEVAKVEEDAALLDEADAPDEFMDPLLDILMTDPVVLPTSKQTVDMSCIRQMLLSEEIDPFNRAPLKIEDVVPDLELKGRVAAWREEMKERRRKATKETEVTKEPEVPEAEAEGEGRGGVGGSGSGSGEGASGAAGDAMDTSAG